MDIKGKIASNYLEMYEFCFRDVRGAVRCGEQISLRCGAVAVKKMALRCGAVAVNKYRCGAVRWR